MNEYGYAVWLYGSRARGDEDVLSDVDVFVVSDTEVSKKEVMQLVPERPGVMGGTSRRGRAIQTIVWDG